jgi:hypothetical protein
MRAQFFKLKQNKKGLHATHNNASAWKVFLKPLGIDENYVYVHLKTPSTLCWFVDSTHPQLISLIQEKMPNFLLKFQLHSSNKLFHYLINTN